MQNLFLKAEQVVENLGSSCLFGRNILVTSFGRPTSKGIGDSPCVLSDSCRYMPWIFIEAERNGFFTKTRAKICEKQISKSFVNLSDRPMTTVYDVTLGFEHV